HSIHPDIICAQELTTDSEENPGIDVPHFISEKLGYHYFFTEAHRKQMDTRFKIQGNGIFSKFPIIKKNTVSIQESDGSSDDAGNEKRIYLEAQIALPKKHISVGTTHLSFTPYFTITPKRKKEVN